MFMFIALGCSCMLYLIWQKLTNPQYFGPLSLYHYTVGDVVNVGQDPSGKYQSWCEIRGGNTRIYYFYLNDELEKGSYDWRILYTYVKDYSVDRSEYSLPVQTLINL